MYASFRRVPGLGYMTVSEILETMHENDLFGIFPEFSKVMHILAVIRATFNSYVDSYVGSYIKKTNFHFICRSFSFDCFVKSCKKLVRIFWANGSNGHSRPQRPRSFW